MRIGHGYDVHRLVTGRKLILGGVDIPHAFGLLGHSDADVVTHALMDALLGAAALGDIGRHFPDTDPAYAGANSLGLLGHVMALLAQEGWRVETQGTVAAIDDWGKRRLAYPINDLNEGHYVLMTFTSAPELPAELDRVLKITEGVIRSMIICKDE